MDIEAWMKDGIFLLGFFLLVGIGFIIYLAYLWHKEVWRARQDKRRIHQ